MLNNVQCIQVVEKVWGWYPSGGDYRDRDRVWCTTYNIPKEVNSWQGFGRTVEAMEKQWADKLNPMEEYMQYKVKDCHLSRFLLPLLSDWCNHFHPSPSTQYQNQQEDNSKFFIEFTHLAALEAINAKGS